MCHPKQTLDAKPYNSRRWSVHNGSRGTKRKRNGKPRLKTQGLLTKPYQNSIYNKVGVGSTKNINRT